MEGLRKELTPGTRKFKYGPDFIWYYMLCGNVTIDHHKTANIFRFLINEAQAFIRSFIIYRSSKICIKVVLVKTKGNDKIL